MRSLISLSLISCLTSRKFSCWNTSFCVSSLIDLPRVSRIVVSRMKTMFRIRRLCSIEIYTVPNGYVPPFSLSIFALSYLTGLMKLASESFCWFWNCLNSFNFLNTIFLILDSGGLSYTFTDLGSNGFGGGIIIPYSSTSEESGAEVGFEESA